MKLSREDEEELGKWGKREEVGHSSARNEGTVDRLRYLGAQTDKD